MRSGEPTDAGRGAGRRAGLARAADASPRQLSMVPLLARLAGRWSLLVLAGCVAVGPDYEPPEPELPERYVSDTGTRAADAGDLARWWTVFADPLLEELVQRAVEENPGLSEAAARVREARAVAAIAGSELYPDLDGEGFARRARTSENLIAAPAVLGQTNELYSAGVSASWELDVWGRVRRGIESADAALEAEVEDARAVLVILAAEVAVTYVDVRAAQARLRYAARNVAIQEGTLRLARDRLETGVGSDYAVARAERNLAATRSGVPSLEETLARAVHRLATLVAAPSAELVARLGDEAPIPSADPALAVGVPADLLRRRPDLRRAERSLAAQTAQIGVSEADLYPRFSLDGSFARVAYEGEKLTESSSDSWSLGPAFRWNLFDGGRVRGAVEVQEARTEQLLARYEQTLLAAVEEVESSLTAWAREQERRDVLVGAVSSAEREVELARLLYELGVTDFENVLLAERELFTAQDRLAQSEGLVSRNLVSVFRALGGGWPAPADPDREGPAPDGAEPRDGDTPRDGPPSPTDTRPSTGGS